MIIGFLTKDKRSYGLTADSATFLDRRSPAYLGGTIEFLLTPKVIDNFKLLTAAVKKGGTVSSEEGMIEAENPAWVSFARAMAPMMAMPSQLIAKLVDPNANESLKILDIAAAETAPLEPNHKMIHKPLINHQPSTFRTLHGSTLLRPLTTPLDPPL